VIEVFPPVLLRAENPLRKPPIVAFLHRILGVGVSVSEIRNVCLADVAACPVHEALRCVDEDALGEHCLQPEDGFEDEDAYIR
jgi:hypothetical protein